MCAIVLSIGAFAQKGESAVGINLNATPCLEKGASLTNFGIAAKYQYYITDPFRVEAVLGYDLKAKGMSVFEAGVNANWLFNIGSKVKVYPIVGLGYANLKGAIYVDYDDDDDYEDDEEEGSVSRSKFYYNLGAGAEYAISDHLSAAVEVKYQGIDHFKRLPISLGIVYKF